MIIADAIGGFFTFLAAVAGFIIFCYIAVKVGTAAKELTQIRTLLEKQQEEQQESEEIPIDSVRIRTLLERKREEQPEEIPEDDDIPEPDKPEQAWNDVKTSPVGKRPSWTKNLVMIFWLIIGIAFLIYIGINMGK